MTRVAIATLAAAGALLALPAQAAAAWTWPLRGEVVTAYRNGADPYQAGQHRGIDIAGAVGDQVVAAVPGLVRFAGTAGSSGRTVSVRSADGRFDLSYLHLDSLAVRRGERVGAGAAIGTVGTSGIRSSDRPHLHFGVRHTGSRHAYLDPLSLLPPPAPAAPRAPEPVAAPAPLPAPVAPRPAPAPTPAPRVPALRPGPSPRRWPATAVRSRAEGSPAAEPAGHAPAASHAGATRPRDLGVAPQVREGPAAEPLAPAPAAEPRARGGVDVGWLLGCAGLLAAGLVLSLGRRTAARPARARAALVARLVPRPRE